MQAGEIDLSILGKRGRHWLKDAKEGRKEKKEKEGMERKGREEALQILEWIGRHMK